MCFVYPSLTRSLTHSEQNIVYIYHAAAAAATSECIRTDVNKIYSQIRCKDCINLIVSESPCKQVHTHHSVCPRQQNYRLRKMDRMKAYSKNRAHSCIQPVFQHSSFMQRTSEKWESLTMRNDLWPREYEIYFASWLPTLVTDNCG